MQKVFIEVTAIHGTDGSVKPIAIRWPDGRSWPVDRVLDVRQAGAMKVGGCGTRYTCRIAGKEVYLFDDEGRWYLETK